VTERRRDPYAILGVSRHASREEIAHAYRARAKRSHPDVAGQATADMQDLNWAWDLLSHAGRRAEWDRAHAGRTSGSHWAEPPPSARAASPAWEQQYAQPGWTVNGEPWAGAGAPAVERRAGIGCLITAMLVLILSALVMFGGFLSGYESPGADPQASEAPAEN